MFVYICYLGNNFSCVFWLDTTADFSYVIEQYYIISEVFEYGIYPNHFKVYTIYIIYYTYRYYIYTLFL